MPLHANYLWKKPSMAFVHEVDRRKRQGFPGSTVAASSGVRLYTLPVQLKVFTASHLPWFCGAMVVCCLVGCGAPAEVRQETSPAATRPSQPTADTPPKPPAAATPTSGRPAALRDVSFDDIKLDMQKGDPFSRDLLPSRVTSLEGTPIRIRGYILPSFQQTGLTQFVLVRDNMECCFGPGALLHDCVVVRMKPGKTASFSIRPVAVTGTFRVDELRGPDGRHLAIYALDGEAVE